MLQQAYKSALIEYGMNLSKSAAIIDKITLIQKAGKEPSDKILSQFNSCDKSIDKAIAKLKRICFLMIRTSTPISCSMATVQSELLFPFFLRSEIDALKNG